MKKKLHMNGHSFFDWYDNYYSGDFEDYLMDENTEGLSVYDNIHNDDGWDSLEEYKSSKAYWKQIEKDYKGVKY